MEIQTDCLGLSPTQIEALTTVPLEAALHGVPGVYDIRSDSEPQLSAIFLYFSGTDELHARQLVQERIQATAHTLPTWCDLPQMYPIVSATSRVMQIGLYVEDRLAAGPVDDGAVAAQAPADGRARRGQRRDLGREAQADHGRGRPGEDGQEPRRAATT